MRQPLKRSFYKGLEKLSGSELATRLRQMLYDRKKKAVKITTMDNTIPKKKNGQLDERKKLADRIKQARESSHIS
jgi:hypothetical protein